MMLVMMLRSQKSQLEKALKTNDATNDDKPRFDEKYDGNHASAR